MFNKNWNTAQIIIAFCLLVNFASYSQSFDKKYFIKSDWFSNNKDSLFFKADTIRLLKYNNIVIGDYSQEEEYDEFEMIYFDHGQYVQLEFDRYGKMKFNIVNDNIDVLQFLENPIWKFNNKTQELTIDHFDGLYLVKFKVLTENSVKINSKKYYQTLNDRMINTIELTLVRMK